MKHKKTLVALILAGTIAGSGTLLYLNNKPNPEPTPKPNPNTEQNQTKKKVPTTQTKNSENNTLTIANWNLEVFGTTKAKDETLLQDYAQTIQTQDIIFLQEIRDSTGTAIKKLSTKLNLPYSLAISSRAGESNSKEQYALFYKTELKLTEFKDYNPDYAKEFNRPPVRATFQINEYKIQIYNIHTDPDKVPKEMSALEKLITDETKNLPPYTNILILGDLNASGSYYNNNKETHFDNWFWAIKDTDDTMVKTDFAYDRIILNPELKPEYLKYQIITQGITPRHSNHFPVSLTIITTEK